jgi:two-component sensor histidine kinase
VEEAITAVSSCNGRLIVPIPRAGTYRNFLVIGKREDQDIFLREDIQQITALSFQIGHALDNTALYEELQNSLDEKVHLLQEIHHRVKNNMQVMSSLLSLQAEYSDNEEVNTLLTESCKRIESMALIHETLYQANNFREVDMADYINSVVGNLYDLYASDREVEIVYKLENIYLPVKHALTCGLITSEVVSNALKYAFDGTSKGTIILECSGHEGNGGSGNEYTLSIRDNGRGIDGGVDTENPDTLGLKLVHILADQVKARIKIHSESGTEFRIEFSVTPEDRLPS